MTNNSPSNSFFDLVLDHNSDTQRATKSVSAAEFADNGMTKAEASSANAMQQAEPTAGSSADAALATAAMQSELATNSATMPHDARRVLVQLMRQGSVMAAQKPKLFELLCRHESAIRKHLSEVYLQLVLDQKTGVAFVASAEYQHDIGNISVAPDAENEDELELDEATTLISKRTLSLFDTLILLVLRKHYQDRDLAGEQKITIDIERLESYLTPFLPITDHASKDRKKLLARVKEMVKRKVLSTIRGTEARYEITPIIRYVVSASFLETMLAEYTLLAQQSADASLQINPIDNHNGVAIGAANE